MLPCGHAYCEECIRDFGQREGSQRQSTTFIHDDCVLCGSSNSDAKWPWRLRLRPKPSGVRLLSLDGGGVRGVVQLEILRRLEAEIGLGLPITDFVDLIVGTSSGEQLW